MTTYKSWIPPTDEEEWVTEALNKEELKSSKDAINGIFSDYESESLFLNYNSLTNSPTLTNSETSLLNSLCNSLVNSPEIKHEYMVEDVPVALNLDSSRLNEHINVSKSLPNFNDLKFDALSKKRERDLASEIMGQAVSSLPTSAAGPKKPKKKRAPRKRLTADQKEAHNKIEKRYRININTKISNLQKIIPGVSNEKAAFTTGDKNKPEDAEEVPKLNKAMILEKAIAYVLHLQKSEESLRQQNTYMLNELKVYNPGKNYEQEMDKYEDQLDHSEYLELDC